MVVVINKYMRENKIIESGNGNVGFEEDVLELTQDELLFKELLKQYEVEEVKVGSTHVGTLVEETEKYYIFDINNKSSVFVPKNMSEVIAMSGIEIGDETEVYITSIIDNKDFIINGSVYTLLMSDLSDTLSNSIKRGEILTGTPVEMNHAGYTVETEINGQTVNLFMPHLLTDVNKIPDQESLLNTEIKFIASETNKDGQTQYIASRKAYLQTLIKKAFSELENGQQYDGVVTGTTKFGVFVQFNKCLTALIHKSNLSEDGLELFNKNEIEPGMLLPFLIKSLDYKKRNIFGTQIAGESLWDNIKIGDVLTGKINDIKAFGLLVELDYETRGLIHKSNMKNVQYNIGEEIDVVITNINKSNRQITLKQK